MIRSPLLAAIVTAGLLLAGIAGDADAGSRRSRPVRTGQTLCFDQQGTSIACAGTGQDGELRRGEPRAYQDNGDGTIRDLRTALMWEKLSDDGSIHDKDTLRSWIPAFTKIEALNTPPCFAGFCDWRLPNISELQTIVDYQREDPAVGDPFRAVCFPGCTVLTCSCTASVVHWSSSSYIAVADNAWRVSFLDGFVTADLKVKGGCVRAVRGGS